MSKTKSVALLLAAALMLSAPVLSGCSPQVGGTDYATSGAQGGYDVVYGTVVSVRTVKINNDSTASTALGTIGGGVVGGIIGNMFGGGHGKTLTTLGGVLAGAALGNVGSSALGSQTGVEVTVDLDNGKTMAVVQGADMTFRPGQRVKILRGQNTTRVVPQ